jgi:MoaA/NifB/PqqE/SkfB family radical SAM enzyme
MNREKWIENPKVGYHPKWLERWRKDPFNVPPIYIEISPAGLCNHRCTFCSPGILGYPKRFLSLEVLGRCFEEMRQLREEDTDGLGFKSVQLAGEGEPALHKDLAEICRLARAAGIDIGLLTNGITWTKKLVQAVVPLVNGYFQISIDAAKAETYVGIHKPPGGTREWAVLWRNIERMVEAKRVFGAECDIGVNMTLLVQEVVEEDGTVIPANWREMEGFVKNARNAGVDYASIKPYAQDAYNQETARRYGRMSYTPFLDEIFEVASRLIEKYTTPSFEVVFRFSRFLEYEQESRGYPICLATPTLWSYIQSDGEWLSCSQWSNPDFVLGNIYINSVKEIWYGEKRREHLDFVFNRLDISSVCRKTCHPDKENRYLARVRNMSDEEFRRELEQLNNSPPAKRVNFI